MKQPILIILIAFVFVACEKETIIKEVEKEYSWKTHPNFLYENAAQMNSYSTDQYLYFNGLYKFAAFGTNSFGADFYDPITGVTMNNYFHWTQSQPPQYKFPISNNFFIQYQVANSSFSPKDRLWFAPSMNATWANSAISFSIKDIDPTYIQMAFIPFWRGECIAINNNDQALIPYYGSSPGSTHPNLRLALVDIKVSTNDLFTAIDTLKTKIIKLYNLNQDQAILVQSLGNDFFFTTNTKTYRINSEGIIAGIYDYHFYDLIEKQDTAYMTGYDFELMQREWSYSVNNGETWNKVLKVTDEYEQLNYVVIDNRIIAYWRAQLFEFKTSLDGVEIVELDNDGLEGKQITSIAKYKDKVFVSSLSGVFYKNLEDLWIPKEVLKD
jgi:hypothetical protein